MALIYARPLLFGGNANNGWNDGVFYGSWNNDAGNSNWNNAGLPIPHALLHTSKIVSGSESKPLGINQAINRHPVSRAGRSASNGGRQRNVL